MLTYLKSSELTLQTVFRALVFVCTVSMLSADGASAQAAPYRKCFRRERVTRPTPILPPDSTKAIELALRTVASAKMPIAMRVKHAVPVHEGWLIWLSPVSDAVLGGSQLLWVDESNCVVVVRKYE